MRRPIILKPQSFGHFIMLNTIAVYWEMTMYCDYSCGKLAVHKFKNGKHCCALNINGCPSNKKRNMFGTPVTIDGLCLHCGKPAKFEFKNGALCCSESVNKCPAKAAKTGEAVAKAFTVVDPLTGKTSNEKRLEKVWATMRTKIDLETGLPLLIANAAKAKITKNRIMPDGKTIQQNINDKNRVTKNSEKGRKIIELGKSKRKATMNQIDPDSGLTLQEKSVRKRLVTMSVVGDDGLTRMERAIKKGQFRGFSITQYPDSEIYYQGSYELNFLNEQREKLGDMFNLYVKRPKAIWYFDPTRNQDRMFFPDFLIDENALYEVKSNWTWNNNNRGSDIEKRNIAKLNAALLIYTEVYLVLEGKKIKWNYCHNSSI